MLTLLRNGFIQRMGLAVNQCVAPAALVVSKPMLAAGFRVYQVGS